MKTIIYFNDRTAKIKKNFFECIKLINFWTAFTSIFFLFFYRKNRLTYAQQSPLLD